MSDYIEDYKNAPDHDAETSPEAAVLLDTEADSGQAVPPVEEMEDGLDEFQEGMQEKPKRRSRRRKDDPPEEPDVMEQDDFSAEEHEAEDGFLPPDNPAQADLSETEAPARRPGRTVILDSFGNVVRERAQSGLHELSVLTAARNARRILTATVDAIETDGEALPRMVFYVGTVKVMKIGRAHV